MRQHKHVVIRAQVKNPIDNPQWGNVFMSRLIKAIGMDILIAPQSIYCDIEGNEGITSFAVITTSHIALHVWDKERIAQLDVYSCKDFDPKVVRDLLDEFMQIEKISSALILRDEEVVTEPLTF